MRDTLRESVEKIDKMATEMEQARAVTREVIFRVVVLSASIVGFSATALSIKNIDLRVNEHVLRISWLLFAAVVILGPLSIYLESRAQYAVTWRANQAMEFDQPRATRREQLQILAVLLYTLLIRPRNLIFVRDTNFEDKRKAWINGVLIQKLHSAWDLALALELVFWLLFAAALALLIAAVAP